MQLVRNLATGIAAAVLLAAPVSAEADAPIDAVVDALRVDETVAVMREEGLAYGVDLAQDMMPDANMESWRDHVGRIYDPGRMQRLVEDGLRTQLADENVAPLAEFFTSQEGARIIELELSARRAFLSPDVEQAARETYAHLSQEGAPIIERIDRLIEDSDLIEHNVTGILNSNLMLYRGLADGGAYEMSEEDMLLDVWGQEDSVREDSAEWIGAYLLTAYRPLEPDVLERYIALWQSDEGQALNRALFRVYDRMYAELSYLMGQAVAQHMRSQKL